jgi:hypothetical protein
MLLDSQEVGLRVVKQLVLSWGVGLLILDLLMLNYWWVVES